MIPIALQYTEYVFILVVNNPSRNIEAQLVFLKNFILSLIITIPNFNNWATNFYTAENYVVSMYTLIFTWTYEYLMLLANEYVLGKPRWTIFSMK